MDNIWTVLGLEPTRDISAIKRAYAEKAKICHPEENPQGFLRLRNAYQSALNYAEDEADTSQEQDLEPSVEADAAEPEDKGWSLSGQPAALDEGPNPYEDHEAIRNFLDLYTGKQRKDSNRWLDYFTSGAFLEAAWQRRFTALLLAHVVRLEEMYPVNREFLNWLCAAYQFQVIRAEYRNPDGSERIECRFQIDREAQFDGQEAVFEIAAKGPAPKQSKGAERAMRSSFSEYRSLLSLLEKGRWSEGKLKKAGNILDYYMIGNFDDRNPKGSERHPAGMRLIEHFFCHNELPKELYQMAWQKLELKTALMGRAKLLYGGLRARVLEQVPDILDGELDLQKLNKDFEEFRHSACALEETGKAEDWEKAAEVTRAFFSRPDFQKALWNRRFAEEHMKYHVQWSGDHFVQEVLSFYEQHPDAPCAEELTLQIAEVKRRKTVERRNEEDKTAPIPDGKLTLTNRSFFRHWLNTGFYHAQDRTNGQGLIVYLDRELPYLTEWSRKFLEYEEGARVIPVTVTCAVGEDSIEVGFYLRHMAFFRNREQVYRPCLPWEQVAALEDADAFFFLLPITMEPYDRYEQVKAEIRRRLEKTAAPADGRELIAACLAGHVCSLPLPDAVALEPEFDEDEEPLETGEPLPPESFLPFEVFAGDGDSLYVCVWFQREQILALFQQTPYGKRAVNGERYDGVTDEASAVTLARQLLEEQLFPKGFPINEMKKLPDAVYTQWDYAVVCKDEDPRTHWRIPKELLGEAVTAEILEMLLTQFQENRMQRLEFSWTATIPLGEEQDYEPRRSLVFLKDHGKYACLYFDDFKAESYALLEKPELYGKENIRPERVPFLRGKLFSQVIHHNFTTIRRHLDVIFRQVSWPGNVKFMAGGIWDHAENVDHGRVKYNLDKQLLADFPLEWAHNRPDARFYFSCHPNCAVLMDTQGHTETLEIHDGNRLLLQQMLARFFQEGIPKLRMTWGRKPGGRRHIVLLQENERFLMAWVQEEKKTARFHVADPWTYMDVEGKKYPKDTFRGRVTPTYLLHDRLQLRNALDLLLANLENTSIITDKIAEYAEEKPVKARPYEALWTELVD